jgi:F420-dependent oxidoreductase-like protein
MLAVPAGRGQLAEDEYVPAVTTSDDREPAMPTWGVHTGLQNTTTDELRSLWRRIEQLGFDWISIWDHFYAADLATPECHEAVSSHAALACTTERVRVGSLVYCTSYRHPAVLANAMATIDHLSGGRAVLGLGAGWAANEFAAYGIPFPGPGERLDILEEAIECIHGLLRDEVTDFHGQHFTLTDARCEPKPVQEQLPIWVGGGGEKRTLAIAARWADGWNVPYVSPEQFAHKRRVLHDHCTGAGRDPAAIACTVNVGAALDEAALQAQFGNIAEVVRPGVLLGSVEQMVDQVGRYVEVGVDQVNLAVRAPWDPGVLDRVAEVMAASAA